MWPCGDVVFRNSVRYTGKNGGVASTLSDVLCTLQQQRRLVVSQPQQLEPLEQYLSMLYVLFNTVVESAYDLFAYNNDSGGGGVGAPSMSWYHATTHCIYSSTSLRFELIMTAMAYAQLLFSQCGGSNEQMSREPKKLRLQIAAMKLCMCVCRDVASVNRRRTSKWIIFATDIDGMPADWVVSQPPELHPRVIALMYDMCAARCQYMLIVYANIAAPPSGDVTIDNAVGVNLTLHAHLIDVLRVTRREQDAAAAEDALVCACIEYVNYVADNISSDDAVAEQARLVALYARELVENASRSGGSGSSEAVARRLRTQHAMCTEAYSRLVEGTSALVDVVTRYGNPENMAQIETMTRLMSEMPYQHVLEVLTEHSAEIAHLRKQQQPGGTALYASIEPKHFIDFVNNYGGDVVRSWCVAFSRELAK